MKPNKNNIIIGTLAALLLSAAFALYYFIHASSLQKIRISELITDGKAKDTAIKDLKNICRADSLLFEQHAAIGQGIINEAQKLLITPKNIINVNRN